MPLVTSRSIARHGGWKAWAPVTGQLLQEPYRHHLVTGQAGHAYFLPAAAGFLGAGTGVPIGTIIWVHNVGAFDIGVLNGDLSFIQGVLANTSASFALIAAPNVYGVWVRVHNGHPHVRGPSQPAGVVFRFDVRQHTNNVDLLAEAVAAGYDGTEPALVTARVWPGVVVGSANSQLRSFTLGGDVAVEGINWFAGSIFLLLMDGMISGAGGDGGSGGIGGTGASSGIGRDSGLGQPQMDGGTALRCPVSCTIASTGIIQGGGGGGNGGNGSATIAGLHGGGGGGGAGATIESNGNIRGGLGGFGAGPAQKGIGGLLFNPGNFGVGSLVTPNTGGRGGLGGAPAQAGSAGRQVNDAGNTGASLSAGGAAISRKSTATVTFVSGAGGTVTGATIVEAS